MGKTVELDSRGRLLLPADIRKKMGTKRFLLEESDKGIELEPIPDPESVKGKHKGLIEKDLEEIEKDQEELVRKGGR